MGEQLLGGGELHDLAGVHDRDRVRPTRHDPEVVGHQDHAHVAFPALVVQQVEDLGLDGDVERGGGFVGEQQLRPAGEGHGDRDPLPHPSR